MAASGDRDAGLSGASSRTGALPRPSEGATRSTDVGETAPQAASLMRAVAVESAAGEATADAVTLPYDDRYRRRGVLTTDAGEEIILDLAEAAELPSGGALLLADGRRLAVRAAVEPLTEARADTARGLARLAWHVGNRHTPAQIEADRLLIQRDHVLEDMLRRLGAAVASVEETFSPEGGAYGHGRTHGHSHAHDPQVDPNAHIPHRHD